MNANDSSSIRALVKERCSDLSSTGTTEDVSDELEFGKMATYKNGPEPAWIEFGATGTLVNRVVVGASLYMNPGEKYDWEVDNESKFLYMQVVNGANTATGRVGNTSP